MGTGAGALSVPVTMAARWWRLGRLCRCCGSTSAAGTCLGACCAVRVAWSRDVWLVLCSARAISASFAAFNLSFHLSFVPSGLFPWILGFSRSAKLRARRALALARSFFPNRGGSLGLSLSLRALLVLFHAASEKSRKLRVEEIGVLLSKACLAAGSLSTLMQR